MCCFVRKRRGVREGRWEGSLLIYYGLLLMFRNLGKLVTVLRAFPAGEPTKRKFVDEMIAWSINFGDFPHGDPELHHVAGSLYAEGNEPEIPISLG